MRRSARVCVSLLCSQASFSRLRIDEMLVAPYNEAKGAARAVAPEL